MRIDVQQARKRAKELVKSGHAATLADAQRDMARELGYDSWPKFVHALDRLPVGSTCQFCGLPIGDHRWLRLGEGVPGMFAHSDCLLAATNTPPLAALGVARQGTEVDQLTPRARRLWAGAATVSREFGHNFVGTEHLLLAMVREPHGIAGRVLDELVGRDLIEMRITEILRSDEYKPRPRQDP